MTRISPDLFSLGNHIDNWSRLIPVSVYYEQVQLNVTGAYRCRLNAASGVEMSKHKQGGI